MSHVLVGDDIPLLHPEKLPQMVKDLEVQMLEAADSLQFELAAAIRDKIAEIHSLVPKSRLKTSPK